MFYFKPPRRGQALYQDQYFLRARPGTCIAAWDGRRPLRPETGCLQVVPGTRDTPVLCAEQADRDTSFTSVSVPLPPTLSLLVMETGRRAVLQRPSDPR